MQPLGNSLNQCLWTFNFNFLTPVGCLKIALCFVRGVNIFGPNDVCSGFSQPLREFIPGHLSSFSALVFKKSVTGPLSRFLHCSDIWCPICARMPPSQYRGFLALLCSLHTPTHICTQSMACQTLIDALTHTFTQIVVKCMYVVTETSARS